MNHAGGYEEYAFIADLYDYVEPYRTRPDINFYVEAAQTCGGPVLEVGCGTGRILIPTARAGVDIVGLDLSPHMLQVCQKRVLAEPQTVQSRIRLVQADMRSFDLAQAFQLITLPFRPFQHLTTVEDQLSCLETIRRHLVEGGRLILDLFNPWLAALVRDNLGQEADEGPEFTTSDGRRVMRHVRSSRATTSIRLTRPRLFTTLPTPMVTKNAWCRLFRCATCTASRRSTCWRAAGSLWSSCTPATTKARMDRSIQENWSLSPGRSKDTRRSIKKESAA